MLGPSPASRPTYRGRRSTIEQRYHRRCLTDGLLRSALSQTLTEATDGAVQGGLPEAGHDPAVPLRVPGGEERVEAVGDGLRAADELCLRALAPFLVLLGRRHRRDWGGVD